MGYLDCVWMLSEGSCMFLGGYVACSAENAPLVVLNTEFCGVWDVSLWCLGGVWRASGWCLSDTGCYQGGTNIKSEAKFNWYH